MIKGLNGVFEQVDYSNDSSILLHVNDVNENYPVHWHPAFEIIMPLENEYFAVMNKKSYSLCENEILIIPPGDLHKLLAPETGKRLIILFDYSLIQNANGLTKIMTLFRQPRLITKNEDADIYSQIRTLLFDIKDEYQGDYYLWEAAAYAKFIQILLLIGRKYMNTSTLFPDANRNKQREYIEKFDLIFEYINQNFTKEISLDSMAAIAGFSKFHFSRLFKQFTNMSFYDYLNKQKIQEAETLLLDLTLSITDVAFLSGFSSISTFNRVFKCQKECTPSEFRTLYRKRYTMEL